MLTTFKYFVLSSPNKLVTSSFFSKVNTNFAVRMAEALDKAKLANANKQATKPYKSRFNSKLKKREWEDANSPNSEAKRTCFNPEDRIKRRKYLILMGYCGANYFGMQRNPDTVTIEEKLMDAMLKNKWITEEGFNQAQTIQFQRAARTDKGVSAVRQCVSLKLPDNLDYKDLNKELPDEIKVFALRRVTKGFNSKEQCNGRTYSYTLPTIAFAKHTDEVDTLQKYRTTPERIIELNEILQRYEGTKNFHNFTSRKEYVDPSAKRYITTFKCSDPFLVQDVEFARIEVYGQSFMLHQIRKMIGLALAILRQHTPIETLYESFTDKRLDVPMAPGLGLVLEKVHYDRYNEKFKDDGFHELLEWDNEEPQIQEFYKNHILPTIVETEINDHSMEEWLKTLTLHTFGDR